MQAVTRNIALWTQLIKSLDLTKPRMKMDQMREKERRKNVGKKRIRNRFVSLNIVCLEWWNYVKTNAVKKYCIVDTI